jgi:diacylglycerol kinase
MPTLFKRNHPVRQLKSFKYALEGIWHAILSEPNFRIQLMIVTVLIFLGKLYRVTKIEWSLIALSSGFLLFMELTNTVIEEIMDRFMKQTDESVKIIKDVSAAAVLITALTVLVNFLIIFGPRIFN